MSRRSAKCAFKIENRSNSQKSSNKFSNKPQRSEELVLGNFALRLVFYPKSLQNPTYTSLHVQARNTDKNAVCSKKIQINCKVILVLVQSRSSKNVTEKLKNESIWIDLTTEPANKQIKQWQSFITKEQFECYSKYGTIHLLWKIEEIATERVISSPDNRLTSSYLSSKKIKYIIRIFDVKFRKMQRITKSMIEDVMNFRLMSKRTYDGYYGMEKMFIDQLWFKLKNGVTELYQKCDHEQGQIQLNSKSFKLKYNDSLALNKNKLQKANMYENKKVKQKSDADISNKYAKKRHYVYMILNPLIARNLPSRAFKHFRKLLVVGVKSGKAKTFNLTDLFNQELFRDFVEAIFYVGCGQKARMHTHCDSARRSYKKKNDTNDSLRDQIHKIWKDSGKKERPILFNFIDKINKFEAKRFEGLVIRIIKSISGLNNLVNQKVGEKARITERNRREFGLYLLCKAFKNNYDAYFGRRKSREMQQQR